MIEPSTSLQLEHYRVIHLVTVGTLSRHLHRYSWNIIEPSTSLQLEHYRAVQLITVGTLSSHPPRYSWNIIESSTSLELEHYWDIHLVTVGTLSSHPGLVKNHASQKIMHCELIFMHRESIHASPVNIHALRVNSCIARRSHTSQKIHASREDLIPRRKFMHREKISYLAKMYVSQEDFIPWKVHASLVNSCIES